MHKIYIIQNPKGRYYIGMTSNLEQRLRHHNSGANRYTRLQGSWKLVYFEDFIDKKQAWLREKQIKKYKGGEAFKKLIAK